MENAYYVCDGIIDCLNKEDERECNVCSLQTTKGTSYCRHVCKEPQCECSQLYKPVATGGCKPYVIQNYNLTDNVSINLVHIVKDTLSHVV